MQDDVWLAPMNRAMPTWLTLTLILLPLRVSYPVAYGGKPLSCACCELKIVVADETLAT
jgi:hypothetical protein